MKGERTQWYIASPGAVVVCADRRDDTDISGTFWTLYSEKGQAFSNYTELVYGMEELFDDIRFPFPSTSERTFAGEAEHRAYNIDYERERVMSDEKLLQKHGSIGTFIVRVQHRQNSSWQGRITWMEEDQTVQFRSTWELIKLIESALDAVSEPEETQEASPAWEIVPEEEE